MKVKNLIFVSLSCFCFFSCKEEIYQNNKNLLSKSINSPYYQLDNHMDIIQKKIDDLSILNQYFLAVVSISGDLKNSEIEKKRQIIDYINNLLNKLSNTLEEGVGKQMDIKKAKLHRLKTNSTKFHTDNFYFTWEMEGGSLVSLQTEIQRDLDEVKRLIDEFSILKTNNPSLGNLLYKNLVSISEATKIVDILIKLNKDKLSAIDNSISYLATEPQIMSKRGEIENSLLNIIEKLKNTFEKGELTSKFQEFQETTNLTREAMNRWYNGKFNSVNHKIYNQSSLMNEAKKDINSIKVFIIKYKEIINTVKKRVLRRIEL